MEKLKGASPGGGDAATAEQLVCFRLADEEFGIAIERVREIVRLPPITHIPRMPGYVRGIANLRGSVLPVIDGRDRLSLPESGQTERTRVLVLDVGGEASGLVVDEVVEVIWVEAETMEEPPAVTQGGVAGAFLDSVVKLDEGRRLILGVKPEAVVGVEPGEVRQRHRSGAGAPAIDVERRGRRRQDTPERQLVTFSLGREEYAFDIQTVKEILRLSPITNMPSAGPEVMGVLAIRGRLLPVFDLRMILGIAPLTQGEQRILVIELSGVSVGLLVDRVNEVLRVPREFVEKADALGLGDELREVVRIDGGKRLIMILAPEKLVDVACVVGLLGEEEASVEGAMGSVTREGERDEEQLVTFLVGEEEFGIHIMKIQEINRMAGVTRVPRTPSFVAGITNLRGHVIPLLDMRKWFGIAERPMGDRSRIIIVDIDGQRTGLIVDQVNEVLRIKRRDIEDPPVIMDRLSEAEGREDFIEGIGKVQGGSRMVLVLDIEKLLALNELRVLAKMRKRSQDSPSGEPRQRTTKEKAGAAPQTEGGGEGQGKGDVGGTPEVVKTTGASAKTGKSSRSRKAAR